MFTMASYDDHVSKRQRTDVGGHGVEMGTRDDFQGSRKSSQSPVVHVRGLSEAVIEADLVDAVQQFGPISYVLMMPKRHQALVEFEDISGAINCINFSQGRSIFVAGAPSFFNFSTSMKIQRPMGGDERGNNKVLLFTILNPQYPINVDVMHTICGQSGRVQRIVIFKKNGVQCMVEFEDADSAKRAKQSLNGADIYSGCCTLKIEYAKPTRLNVFKNDNESWDYTQPNLGKEAAPSRNAPLLEAPKYGAGPTPFSAQESARRPMPPPSHGGFGGGGNDVNMGGGYGGQGDGYESYPPRGERSYMPPPQHERYSDPFNSASPREYGGGHGHGNSQNFQADRGGPDAPSGMLQQNAVLMVYGLNKDRMNSQKLFNLFCLYGNVVRVKFLKSKEGAAMIQMGDNASCERAMKNLNNTFFFGAKMQLGYSKQAFLQDVPNPHELPDGTPSFMDFMGNRNNRFTNPDVAARNRIYPPGKSLYYFNAPPNLSDDEIRSLFTDAGVKEPDKIKQFPSKSERSSTGLLEWDSKTDAVEALAFCNHVPVDHPGGKNPYIFKLCFSSSPIMGM